MYEYFEKAHKHSDYTLVTAVRHCHCRLVVVQKHAEVELWVLVSSLAGFAHFEKSQLFWLGQAVTTS